MCIYIYIYIYSYTVEGKYFRTTLLIIMYFKRNSFCCKFQKTVYMPKLSRTEMLSTVSCSKFRGASFTFLQLLH